MEIYDALESVDEKSSSGGITMGTIGGFNYIAQKPT